MEQEKNWQEIGGKILRSAQSQLYMALPYLDNALCALTFEAGDDKTMFLATDGEMLWYNCHYLADRFLRGGNVVNRLYLHTVLHCLLRHIAKKRGRDSQLWDLSCDIVVESVLDSLEYPCLTAATAPLRHKVYGEMRCEMPVLTAEGIYRHLLRQKMSPFELARWQKEFFADDHGYWDPEQTNDDQRQRQDQDWRDRSERTRTAMDTVLAGQATGGEAVYEQVQVATRESVDYRAFLRRFAVYREVMEADGDAFDYIFYTYGLQLYGNMPLVEPPETREQRRIEDFVIAIDTSMSTSGDLVREFLASTYSILRSTETFTRKVNIRILQCDDQLRRDDVITNLDELKAYMEDFHLVGGSATDFRPIFEHVDKLRAQGAFTQLRGLIYFTDGMGTYPKKRPPYEAAFVMLKEPPMAVQVPPWAIKLVLTEDELHEAAVGEGWEDYEADLAEMPEL